MILARTRELRRPRRSGVRNVLRRAILKRRSQRFRGFGDKAVHSRERDSTAALIFMRSLGAIMRDEYASGRVPPGVACSLLTA
ncbi:unnamed protein product [Colias eurytheme]|nr:unnamed protein product [Colias eurytheme]